MQNTKAKYIKSNNLPPKEENLLNDKVQKN